MRLRLLRAAVYVAGFVLVVLVVAEGIWGIWSWARASTVERAVAEVEQAGAEKVLRFEVVDPETGAPLPEVTYTLRAKNFKSVAPITASGRYEYSLPKDEMIAFYTVSAPGRARKSWHLSVPERCPGPIPIHIALERARVVQGCVMDEDGAPIEGVKVDVVGFSKTNATDHRMAISSEAMTDETGNWIVTDIAGDDSNLEVRLLHPDYVSDYMDGRKIGGDGVGESVEIMRRGRAFRGHIVDSTGKSVAGAQLSFYRGHGITAVTGADGEFEIPHLSEAHFAQQTLTVTAPEYSTVYHTLTPEQWKDDFKLTLQPGKPLRLKLLDDAGAPLTNSEVFVSIGTRADGQCEYFNLKTDGAGGLTIYDAPDEVFWDFSVQRKLPNVLRTLKWQELSPGEEVHVLRFTPLPRATILARDAATGKPLDNFFVTFGKVAPNNDRKAGWLESLWARATEWNPPAPKVNWDGRSRAAASHVHTAYFEDYDHEPMAFLVDAENYYAERTPILTETDGHAQFIVDMRRGESMKVRAVDGKGQAVNAVQAAWVSLNEAVDISNGVLRSGGLVPGDTYEDGMVVLPPVAGGTRALAMVSEYGAAIMKADLVKQGQDITLQPWGSLRGTLTKSVAGIADAGVGARLSTTTADGVKIGVRAEAQHGSDGKFQLTKLFPGEYSVGPVQSTHQYFGTLQSTLTWAKVTVKAGESAEVALAGGCTVKGQLEMPEEAWAWFRKRPINLEVVRDGSPSDRRLEMFLTTNSAGEARVAALPSGSYTIKDAYINDPDVNNYGKPIKYFVRNTKFTVPEGLGADAPALDLGIIPVVEAVATDAPKFKAGDAAPEFNVTTLDGKALSLSALRGKVVLVDFWATWCGPCREEMPNVKRVWEQYGKHDDFLLLGVSFDDDLDALNKYLAENKMSWPQAFLNGWHGNDISDAYRIRGIPEIIVIDRQGKLAATGLRGGDIDRAVSRALGS